jgi:LPXTG-motif cell wall-anchored protein
MKLRQFLAVGAASALLTPAVGALVAAPAYAAEGDVILAVDSPGVVGVHAKEPLTFDVKVENKSGDVHADARLFLKLSVSDFFLDRKDELDPSALKLEFKDASGEFKKIDLKVDEEDEDVVTGSPDVKFLQDEGKPTETLTLRIAVDDPKQKAAPEAKPDAEAAKGDAAGRAKALLGTKGVKAKGVGVPPGTECTATELGFKLDSSLSDVDEDGKPVGNPIATDPDPDEVEIAEAAASFEGLSGDIVAGAAPKAFKLTLCNPSDSAFDNVAALLELFRGIEGGEFVQLKASDVILEMAVGKSWVPVPVEQDEEFVVAVLADKEGNGVPLAAHQKKSTSLRLGFKKGSVPGEAGSVATAILPEIEKFGAFSLASFQIVAPKPAPGQGRPGPELPDTGGNVSVGMIGAGLLVAGAGAVMVTRRRRETA